MRGGGTRGSPEKKEAGVAGRVGAVHAEGSMGTVQPPLHRRRSSLGIQPGAIAAITEQQQGNQQAAASARDHSPPAPPLHQRKSSVGSSSSITSVSSDHYPPVYSEPPPPPPLPVFSVPAAKATAGTVSVGSTHIVSSEVSQPQQQQQQNVLPPPNSRRSSFGHSPPLSSTSTPSM